MTSSIPREGEWLDLGPPGAWPAAELIFEPDQGARVVVGDHRREAYHGYRQFQEDWGLFWGATNDVGAAPRGEADFSLVLFQIR